MPEFSTQETSETRLAALLGELLEGEGAGGGDGTVGIDVPAEIAEMHDMARLLRAASQSVPLPEGRLAVRRALLATLEPRDSERFPARAAWRRTGRWLGVAAVVGMIIGAFGLGAGLLDHIGSPSNPLYGLRRAVDRVRLALVPGRPEGGPSPFVSPAPRIPETGNIPPSGIARPAGVSGYPLAILFTRVTIPSAPGQEVTVQGKVGGLPVTLSLTATAGCPAGKACGDFEAWVTPLRGTKASPEFGQMRGTFICAKGECTLTPVSKTGVFNTTSAFVLQWNASGELAGLVATGFDSLGEWVAAVAQVAEKLNQEDLLPPGVTVKDLVNDAASNKIVSKPSPQGMSGGSAPSLAGVGAPTATGLSGVSVGTGMGTSPSSGAVNTSSVGVSVAGTTVTIGGTTIGTSSTSTTSTNSSAGTTVGSTSTSGTSSTPSGGVSVNAGSVNVSVGGGTSTSGGSPSGGSPSGGSAPSGGGTPGGSTGSGGGVNVGVGGGGVNVGVGGVGVSVGGGGVSVGAGGGTGSGGGGTSGGGLGTR